MEQGVIIALSYLLIDVVDSGLDEDQHWRSSYDFSLKEYELSKQPHKIPDQIDWQIVIAHVLKDERFIKMLNDMAQPMREYRNNHE